MPWVTISAAILVKLDAQKSRLSNRQTFWVFGDLSLAGLEHALQQTVIYFNSENHSELMLVSSNLGSDISNWCWAWRLKINKRILHLMVAFIYYQPQNGTDWTWYFSYLFKNIIFWVLSNRRRGIIPSTDIVAWVRIWCHADIQNISSQNTLALPFDSKTLGIESRPLRVLPVPFYEP